MQIDEILADLAVDLDFYEPDPAKRREDPSFYGDDRLESEIAEALIKIRAASTLGRTP